MSDEDEDCLPELMTEIVPEDGCLAVLDTGDRSTIALTREGIGSLKQLVSDHKKALLWNSLGSRMSLPYSGA
jgi:hypothetical protein